MAHLSSFEQEFGNVWLKTIFLPAVKVHLIDRNKYIKSANKSITEKNIDYIYNACSIIYKNIINLTFDVNDNIFKPALEALSVDKTSYYDGKGKEDSTNRYYFKVEQLARILANMCAKAQIYWDATTHTAQELEYFKKTTFGAALWEFYCFNTQEEPKAKTTAPKSTSAASTGTATPNAGHTLERSNARGILSTQKLTNISGGKGVVYWIGGEFVSNDPSKPPKTQPKLHVKPQDAKTPLKVDYGSGQGYNDCILYFTSEAAAKNFMNSADAHKPNKVKSLQIKKIGEDKNGYDIVETEFGRAYIKASKLKEALEPVTEEVQPQKTKEEYEAAINEAMDKLVAFMR